MLLSENGNGDRRAAELDARIVEKIKRTAAPAEVYHVAGRVMGHELAEVEGDDGSGLVITSDGWAQIGGGGVFAARGGAVGLFFQSVAAPEGTRGVRRGCGI